MKVGVLVGVISFLMLGLFMVPGAFAAPTAGDIATSVVENVKQILAPFIEFFLGDSIDSTLNGVNTFSVRFLFGILLFFLVSAILVKVDDKNGLFGGSALTMNMLSLVITLLMVRYIAPESLLAVVVPGSALANIVFFLPLFFFVIVINYLKITRLWRKVLYLFFLVGYIVNYYTTGVGSTLTGAQDIMYWLAIGFILVMFFFLDSWMVRMLATRKARERALSKYIVKIADLEAQMKRLIDAGANSATQQKAIQQLQEEISFLQRQGDKDAKRIKLLQEDIAWAQYEADKR